MAARVRLACAGSAVQPVAALPHRHRRRAGALHPRAFAGTGRVPDHHHPRLARFGFGVPRHHRPAVQPARPRRRSEGRVPRRVPVDPRVRLVGPDHTARLGCPPRRQRVEGVDGAPRATTATARKAATGARSSPRRSRQGRRHARRRVAQQHAAGVPGQRRRALAVRGRSRRPRGGRRIHAAGERVSGDPGQEPADARLRAHRFTGGARGLDRREVLRVDRPRR